MAESNSIDMNATTGDEPDIQIPSSFTNFLQNEDPFFCSWGRDSNANKTETVEKEEDGSLEKSELTHHVHGIIGCKEKVNAPETVKLCGLSTEPGYSNACKNVNGSIKEKEDASLQKTELTHHVHGSPGPDARIVYIDGAFDLFHAGHVEMLRLARDRGDFLLVGIHTDQTVSATRGLRHPIMSLHERSLSVLACRYVDEVIIGAPWEVSKDMITTFNISLVVHGTTAENTDFQKEQSNPYAVPISLGIFQVLDSPLDITTTTIIRRIVSNQEAYQIIGCKEKDNAPENVKLCGPSTGDSSACNNVNGSNEEKDNNVTGCNKEKEDASLQNTELTHHVPNPITTDKIIGCKAEKDNAPENVKLCGQSTRDSNACKNMTGSNKEKEDGSLKKTESIAVPISDKETKLDQGLTSFIKKVNSVFTRWSWDDNASKNELGSTSTKEGENLSFPSLMSRFVVSLKTLGLWLLFFPILLPLGLWLLFFSPFLIIDRNNAQDEKCCMSAKKRRNRKTKRDLASLAPVFTKVQDLHPQMENINLIIKVVNVKSPFHKGQMPVTEAFVGDETGMIIFRAVGTDKINKFKAGSTILLRKAKIIMHRGSMKLGGCKAEDIEEFPPAAFTVKEDCNVSLIEY